MQFKLSKKKKNFQKKHFSSQPHFFWMVLLSITFFIVFISFGFALFVFLQVNKDTPLSQEELGGQVDSINMESLNTSLKYFSDREKTSSQMLNSKGVVVDPSL